MSEHLNNQLLIDYLRGELPPEDDALVLSHLDTCRDCRREYEIEASIGESLRSAALREELEFPSIVAARVWETIRKEKPSPLAQLAAYFRPAIAGTAIAVPIAAAIALALFFATPLSHLSANAKVDAAYYLEVHAAQQAQNPLADRGPAAARLIETAGFDAGTPTELADAVDYGLAAPGTFDAVR